MQSARFHKVGEPLKIEQSETPQPGKKEALVRVRAASICHSDVHVTTGVLVAKPPVTLGHEIAGEVEQVGSEVDSTKKGDRVVVYFLTPCGDCDMCIRGRQGVCRNIGAGPMYGFSADGGYADYIKVDSRQLVQLPQNVPFEFGASLGCAGITAFHAVSAVARVQLGDRVAVYGTGGVGMYVLQLARLAGASTTIAIGRTDEKLKMAQDIGSADAAVNITKEKLRDSVKAITSARGLDVVFDFVGSTESIDSSLRLLANSGRLVLVGVNDSPATVNPKIFALKEVSMAGSFVGTKRELQTMAELAGKGRLKGVVNTNHRYRLDQVNEALNALKEGKVVGRACVIP